MLLHPLEWVGGKHRCKREVKLLEAERLLLQVLLVVWYCTVGLDEWLDKGPGPLSVGMQP